MTGTLHWFVELFALLLLDVNAPVLNIGPGYFSAFGPPCRGLPVADLQRALEAAGWHPVFEEFGYQLWSEESQTNVKKIPNLPRLDTFRNRPASDSAAA